MIRAWFDNWVKKPVRKLLFKFRGHLETLRLIFFKSGYTQYKSRGSDEDLSSDRFEGLLNAFNAIEQRTPGDGWRLRLNGRASDIVGPPPGSKVSIGTIRRTQVFLQAAGLTPDTFVDFLGRA
jgi:hypothetical protein